ncbi:MAG: hypothetical protein HYS76_02055, partial [Candidatus Wildermuthbacteria bacterium]|nr:hypothetical protein [Candidatus Wildermuthbacteria bacterium]
SYKASIKKLKAVLEGKRTSVMRAIQAEMKRESARGEFERAGRLRDQYFALEKIAAHGVAAMPLSAPPLEYEAISQELSHILRTTFPISRIEEFDVSNIQGKHAVGSMVVFVHGRSAPSLYRKFAIRGLAAPNDVAMMNEIVSRRLKHQEWDMPDLLIVDGGRGQLSTALAAIRESALPFCRVVSPEAPFG